MNVLLDTHALPWWSADDPAQIDGLTLVTRDKVFAEYGVLLLHA